MDKGTKDSLMNATSTMTSVGAMCGVAYGISQKKSFWTTTGFALLFAIAGAALGATYQTYAND
jgi:hypothetical protein